MPKNHFWVGCLVGCGLVVGGFVSAVQANELGPVAKRMAKGLKGMQNKYVAVLPFTYPHDEMSSGSTLVAERLTTELVELHVPVVERSQLEKVMGEIKLEMSGAMDAVSAQKLGKMLGVDAVVTGSLTDFERNETEVNARLIRTDTGEILAAGTATIERRWTDAPRRPQIAERPAPSNDSSGLHMSELIPVHYGANGPGNVPNMPDHAGRPAPPSSPPGESAFLRARRPQ